MTDWVDRIGDYRVEKLPVGTGSRLSTTLPSACLHTTEGSTLDGAVATIKGTGFAPHFTVGDDRIVQMRPLGAQGAALRAHNDIYIQIEAVGFSKMALNNLTAATFRPLTALAVFLEEHLSIPLSRPKGWSDKLPAGTWADDNPRRQTREALRIHGWFGHVDVPDQSPTWHWDPGSFAYSQLFAAAAKEIDVPLTDEQKANLHWLEGLRDFLKGAPEPGGPSDKRAGWRFARSISPPKPSAPQQG